MRYLAIFREKENGYLFLYSPIHNHKNMEIILIYDIVFSVNIQFSLWPKTIFIKRLFGRTF